MALTSALGGKNVYGDSVASDTTFLVLKRITLEEMEQEEMAIIYSAVEVDFEKMCCTASVFRTLPLLFVRKNFLCLR